MAKRTKSARKRVKTSKKRKERNLETKKLIKKTFKEAGKGIKAKAANVSDLLKKAVSTIDKAVERGIIHKNKAARKKSRLLAQFNKAA